MEPQEWILEFSLPGLPPNPNNSGRGKSRNFWAVRSITQEWKRTVFLTARGKAALFRLKVPFQKAKLTLTRCSSVAPDFDGMVASFKPVIDGLVAAGILANDRMANIGQPTYNWERAAPKAGMIRVRVEGIPQEDTDAPKDHQEKNP